MLQEVNLFFFIVVIRFHKNNLHGDLINAAPNIFNNHPYWGLLFQLRPKNETPHELEYQFCCLYSMASHFFLLQKICDIGKLYVFYL